MTEPISAEVRKADEEYAAIMRELIRHENDVTNHRTTWLMITQGLLFTAVSAVIKDVPWAAAAVAFVGILVTISIGHSLKNSYDSRSTSKTSGASALKIGGTRWRKFFLWMVGALATMPSHGYFRETSFLRLSWVPGSCCLPTSSVSGCGRMPPNPSFQLTASGDR